jgi:Protein of unknown function (DUF1765)
MGLTCSFPKERRAKPDPLGSRNLSSVNLAAADDLQNLLEDSNSSEISEPPVDVVSSNLEPPHEILDTASTLTPSNISFFIQISKFRAQLAQEGFFKLKLDFAKGSKKMSIFQQNTASFSPEFNDELKFTWETSNTKLENLRLIIKIYKQEFSSSPGDDDLGSPRALPGGKYSLYGFISIPLRSIATGPVHHDLSFHSPNSQEIVGRLQCDIQMEQICIVSLIPQKISVKQGHFDLTDFQEAPISEEEECHFEWRVELLFTTSSSNCTGNEHEKGGTTEWSSQCAHPVWESLPRFLLKTTEDSLDRHHLKFIIHKRHRILSVIDSKDTEFGECWVNLGKLVKYSKSKTKQDFQMSEFYDEIHHKNEIVGRIDASFLVQNHPIYHQLSTGINTDHGFLRSSTLTLPKSSPSSATTPSPSELPMEIKVIALLHKKLSDLLFSEGATTPGGQLSPKVSGMYPSDSQSERRRILLAIQEQLKKESSTTSSSSTDSLIASQRILVDLAMHLSESLASCNLDENIDYYTTFFILLKRPEIVNFTTILPDLHVSPLMAILKKLKKHQLHQLHQQQKTLPSDTIDMELCDLSLLGSTSLRLKNTHPDLFNKYVLDISTGTSNQASSRSTRPLSSWLLPWRGSQEEPATSLSDSEIIGVFKFEKRMRICKDLMISLHSLLYNVLFKLSFEPSAGDRRVTALILSLLYFRLPNFRSDLLSTLLSPNDINMHIYGCIYSLDSINLEHNRHQQRDINDWEPFHTHLHAYYPNEIYDQIKLLAYFDAYYSNGWRQIFINRGSLFHAFIISIMRLVRGGNGAGAAAAAGAATGGSSIPGKSSKYLFVGYLWLLKSVIIDVLVNPTDGLIASIGAFIAINRKLLPLFMKLYWSKTSIYNQDRVYKAFQYLDYWLTVDLEYHNMMNVSACISACTSSLMDNFDYKFLLTGIQRAIDSQLAIIQAQSIWFLYKQYHRIMANNNAGNSSQIQLRELMAEKAIELILHWHIIVRKVFAYFVIYQVSKDSDSKFKQGIVDSLSGLFGCEDDLVKQICSIFQMNSEETENRFGASPYVKYAREAFSEAVNSYMTQEGDIRKQPIIHIPMNSLLERDSEPS